jgi:hypothetical protein
MRRVIARIGICCLAILSAVVTATAQQTSETFRWVDFHASQDQNIVAWVSRSLESANWTSIREIGVIYDAALVVTENRANPQAAPGAGTFTIWTASLTQHTIAPLVTGANLRWFEPIRFADDARDELPILYDNCRDCQPNTYFTAFYYDFKTHNWAAHWISGDHGVPVWNVNHPATTQWTQVYALQSNGEGHFALYTWNHFDYPKPRRPEDIITRYDLDPMTHLERSVVTMQSTPPTDAIAKRLAQLEMQLCRADTAPAGLARGQDSQLCQDLLDQINPRKPVTSPPTNNRGQSAPPAARTKR